MNNLPGYAAAQREYDNRTPPDDGPCECPDCSGTGINASHDSCGHELELKCETCEGFGFLNADGDPHDPHKAEHDADDYADRKRDEALTREPADYGNDF
jgi:hypothetical protein